MFTVIQVRDLSMRPLDQHIIRTVLAVDRATESFLIAGSLSGEFLWIPMSTCMPCRG